VTAHAQGGERAGGSRSTATCSTGLQQIYSRSTADLQHVCSRSAVGLQQVYSRSAAGGCSPAVDARTGAGDNHDARERALLLFRGIRPAPVRGRIGAARLGSVGIRVSGPLACAPVSVAMSMMRSGLRCRDACATPSASTCPMHPVSHVTQGRAPSRRPAPETRVR
jgi:hypothetical protein